VRFRIVFGRWAIQDDDVPIDRELTTEGHAKLLTYASAQSLASAGVAERRRS
jgi:hypothetical protein